MFHTLFHTMFHVKHFDNVNYNFGLIEPKPGLMPGLRINKPNLLLKTKKWLC
jgi:hypothetical protein